MTLSDQEVVTMATLHNSSKNGTDPNGGAVSVDNLYPAIFQCFAIILGGYIAGRAKIITQAQGKGIGTFVGKFCLPALLFKNMVELQFEQVNWYFLLGIGISKTSVFFGVLILTLLLKRPTHFGYAGLFAIFATQSNDFALGYPILKALYGASHPEYLQYIYLVAPISLVMLNPIGFTLMELHKRQADRVHARSKLLLFLHVAKDVVTNPIVFMVLVGIAGNFLFQQKIPTVIRDVLEVLGNAYSASALFYLGLSMVGKVQSQFGISLIVPLLLISAKTLLLPLITWQVVGALEMDTQNTSSRSLSMYGFLYGTFPTAPSVFLYASQFSIAQDFMATGMVVGTFLSAPLMFASAKMMTVVVNSEMDYKTMLLGTSFDLSVISIVCNIWVLALLFFSRRFKKMPHHFLVFLLLGQTLACIGMIVYDGLDSAVQWQHYVQFVVLLVGVFCTRCQTAVISMALYLLHARSLCYLLRVKMWLYMFGIGFPVLCTGLLLIFGSHHISNEIDPSFHYGTSQALTSLIVLAICSGINITFLVLQQRHTMHHPDPGVKVKRRGHHGNSTNTELEEDEEASVRERLLPDSSPRITPRQLSKHSPISTKTSSSEGKPRVIEGRPRDGEGKPRVIEGRPKDGEGKPRSYRPRACSGCAEDCDASLIQQKPASTNIEDIIPFPSNLQTSIPRTESTASSSSSEDTLLDSIEEATCTSGQCNYKQRQRCAGLLRCYHATNNIVQVEELPVGGVRMKQQHMGGLNEYQKSRFIILLLVLQLSMFTGIFLCTWRMFNKGTSGIYVEIEFLDGFFNYGQSLVVFAIFGFDTRLMILPCLRRWRKWIYGAETVYLPAKDDLPEEDRHLCDQFVKYHRDNCSSDIVKDMRYRFRTYNEVFCGSAFCDWMIEVGLCQDREQAVQYGRALLRGQVIGHVTSEHNFHDMPYFYRFTTDDSID